MVLLPQILRGEKINADISYRVALPSIRSEKVGQKHRLTVFEIISECNQEIHVPQSHTADKPVRKSHTTITRHQEDKQSKSISSLFPIEVIAKLEWTQSINAQQNKEQLQNPTMGATTNNESITTELTVA